MEQKDEKLEQQQPRLWYWSQPQEGMSIEDCEQYVEENRQHRSLMIAFV